MENGYVVYTYVDGKLRFMGMSGGLVAPATNSPSIIKYAKIIQLRKDAEAWRNRMGSNYKIASTNEVNHLSLVE